MKKTVVKIYLEGTKSDHPYYRVKLNSEGFPYIIVDNDQIFLNSSEMSELISIMGVIYKVTKIENKEELDEILKNPKLTIDKLSLTQVVRVSTI